MTNKFLVAALEYEAKGFSVIPIQPRAKRALIQWEEYQKRRATSEEIREWWKKWPNANVGIVTGAISGIIVIDIDSVEAKERLKQTFPEFDFNRVPRVTTGKGWHLYFRHPQVSIQNRTGVIPGIDVRGDGGYVLAPPSIHPSGREYH